MIPSESVLSINDGSILTIHGGGFSPSAKDVELEFTPAGICNPRTFTTTIIVCEMSALKLGPLVVTIQTRGTPGFRSTTVSIVTIPVINIPPHLKYLESNESGYDAPASRMYL